MRLAKTYRPIWSRQMISSPDQALWHCKIFLTKNVNDMWNRPCKFNMSCKINLTEWLKSSQPWSVTGFKSQSAFKVIGCSKKFQTRCYWQVQINFEFYAYQIWANGRVGFRVRFPAMLIFIWCSRPNQVIVFEYSPQINSRNSLPELYTAFYAASPEQSPILYRSWHSNFLWNTFTK